MKILQNTEQPISKRDLIKDFQTIGIKNGMNLMVHSSLSKIGWVIGGAQTVISALVDIVGSEGTIVMPSATPYCLHPKSWEDIEIPKHWIPKITECLPVFEINTTPTTLGVIPETFRNWPGTLRSDHPISSVCARGKLAAVIIQKHNLEISEGKDTPYEKVYEIDFNILLLGVGFNRCTMLHFAEFKSKNRRLTVSNYPILIENKRVWIEVQDMGNDNSTHFPKIGELFLNEKRIKKQKIGEADSFLFPAKAIVDFGVNYFDNK
jgi:aminoglycoside 3-N-acetyltransferase